MLSWFENARSWSEQRCSSWITDQEADLSGFGVISASGLKSATPAAQAASCTHGA